ncbi:MAG TPA: type II secretion system protein GspE [Armatimonadetes bacterium]|nr:type II secretion system protein GspE [Armatimonadota bacterium]
MRTDWEDRRIGQLLLRRTELTEGQLNEALDLQRETPGERLGQILVELGYVSREEVLTVLAEQFRLPLLQLRERDIDPEVIGVIPPELAYRHQVLPLARRDDTLRVAIADPLNLGALDDLRLVTGLDIEPVLADPEDIRRFVEEHYMKRIMADVTEGEIEIIEEEEEDIADLQRLAREALVIKLVDYILRQAVQERASDVHIEPFERELKVRFRIDGVLHDMPSPPPKRLQAAITSRIKIMADLDIAERRLPQDGRIKLRVLGKEIDLRVSTVPTLFGESVVLRILDKSAGLYDLEELGFSPETREKFLQLLNVPYGIILSTGPTGSGKTTTLYAALRRVSSPTRKVITIEDPVEYQLEGINQINVRPQIGLDFASGLRHILRQDPDVIMVGEIRDVETADIAIHAALTGHLVFSTLHTNDASGAITRLLDMRIEPFLVSSSIEGVLAQRLVRRICQHCLEEYQVPYSYVSEYVDPKREEVQEYYTLYRGRGCEHCRNTGYRGRIGLFELLVMDDLIKEMVLKRASAGEIKEIACERGMKTLREDGWDKARRGLTTLDEIARITHADERVLSAVEV